MRIAMCFLLLASCVALAEAQETVIEVDANKPAGGSIPRTIFGSFLEPIGNSTYNGLWAEVLQNPSFEENLWDVKHIADMAREEPQLARSSEMALPLPWEPLRYAQGARYAPQWNDAANSYRSLLLMALPDQPTGIRQKVYLPVGRTSHYAGSIYLKLMGGPAKVEISLRPRNNPDKILAGHAIELQGTEWQRYDFVLDIPAHALAALEPADFVIAASDGTRVLVDQASLMPGDNIDGMDPEMVAMARAMKSPVIRFGGNFTSAYHWRDGVGPRDKRVSMLNTAWGIPEYNQFGTDEFLRFCQLVGAQPQIALNLGTGTPQEAAEWVEYVNAHWEGRGQSGGLLWELGNELWGNFQVGYPTLGLVAGRTKAFSEAVRKVDPNARLIATGGDPDSDGKWNEAQLGNPSGTFDFLSTHFVVTTTSVQMPHASPDFLAAATFALPIELERRLRAMHQQAVEAHSSVTTAFTEWLYWAPDDLHSPRYDNMGGAIGTAGFLNMLLRNAEIVPVSDMTGIIEFGGIWKKRGGVYGVPAYWAFRMYSNADAARLIEIRSNSETYNVEQGSTRLPRIENVPYLDVVAALSNSGDKLTLFCVNRHLTRDMPARIKINGFRPRKATAHSLAAESIYEKNDEGEPQHILPRDSALIPGTPIAYSFRHESVTVIELEK